MSVMIERFPFGTNSGFSFHILKYNLTVRVLHFLHSGRYNRVTN
jgi:hypothetical protein